MAFTIGFDEGRGRRHEGFLGSLGSSIAGAMSPAAEGFGGSVRAFLNPGPTLRAEERQQQLASVRPVYEKIADFGQQALRLMMADDEPGAVQVMAQAQDYGEQNGIARNDKMFEIFNTMRGALTKQKLGNVNWNAAPADIMQHVGPLSETPDQASLGAARLQDIYTGGAQQKRTEQATGFEKTREPKELAKLQGDIDYNASRILTDAEQRKEIDARTGLLNTQNTGAGITNEQEALNRDFMKKNQEKMGTRSTAAASRPGIDDERPVREAGQKALDFVNAGVKDKMGYANPMSDAQARPVMDWYHSMKASYERDYPDRAPLPSLELVQVPAQEGQPGGVRMQMVQPGQAPGQGQAPEPEPTRRVQIPGQPPGAQQQQTEFNLPLTPESLAKVPAGDLENLDFDVRMVSPQALPQVKALKKERARALAAARTPEEERTIKAAYAQRILAAMAAGEQGR